MENKPFAKIILFLPFSEKFVNFEDIFATANVFRAISYQLMVQSLLVFLPRSNLLYLSCISEGSRKTTGVRKWKNVHDENSGSEA